DDGGSECTYYQHALEPQSDKDKGDEAGDTQPGDVEDDHPGQQGRAEAERDTGHAKDGAQKRCGGVFLGDEVHHDHHHEGERDAMGQDRGGGGHAGPREPEGRASAPGRRGELAAQEADERGRCHWLALLTEPCTVATAEAPIRKDSSGFSTLMRTGKRAARRIQSSERSTRGNPLTLVPFS